MRIQLTGGAYTSRSIIAAAQKQVNLFSEAIPKQEGEPSAFTLYPTPGLIPLVAMPNGGPIRGAYTGSNGLLYVASGSEVYRVDGFLTVTHLGSLTTSSGPVYMCDNTLTVVVVDGSAGGLQIDIASNTASPMPSADDGWYGSDRADYLDTYLLFNKPGTPQFYCSDSLATTFDSLYFANKSAAPDYLVAAIAVRGQIWLIGQRTCEVWVDSGASDFPFQKLPGVLIEHGCRYVHSIAKTDGSIFFVSQDAQGRGIVLRASGYEAKRISTHAIEDMIAGIPITTDFIGYAFQMNGHTFYVLTATTGDVTLVYDETNELWNEWASGDGAGAQHRHRSSCYAQAFDTSIVGDYQTGQLWALSLDADTENGIPITWVRSFPHMVKDGERITYQSFTADMEAGYAAAGVAADVTLRWSDDRGRTFGNPLTQSFGTSGEYLTQAKWNRLGLARDRVFELSSSAVARTALNGAFIEILDHKS